MTIFLFLEDKIRNSNMKIQVFYNQKEDIEKMMKKAVRILIQIKFLFFPSLKEI
jgi:hypothetical protein